MMEHQSHPESCDPGRPSAGAVQPQGYQECGFSRTFVSETQAEQEHQFLPVLIHGTSQEPSWGETPPVDPRVQGTALWFVLFKNKHSQLTENPWIEVPSIEAGGLGSKWKGLDTELPPCACGESCYPKKRSCIQSIGFVYHSGMGRERRAATL